MKVHIVDYGMGNIFSVQKKLLQEDVSVTVSSNANDIDVADKIILLGVGHFKKAMDNLHDLNLIEPLSNFALVKKKPILGICLGMQLMTKCSQEGGKVDGLSWIDAEVKKFTTSDSLQFKIPHIGWNTVTEKQQHPIMTGIKHDRDFYFVHSYAFTNVDASWVVATSTHGQEFASIIAHNNYVGVQFHPEKSQSNGLRLIENFCLWSGVWNEDD